MMQPTATVVIVTKNRKAELRASVRSAVEQTTCPDVLVMDDGSDDGSAEMVEREFRDVRVVRFARSEGYIVRRNEAARLVLSPIIVSIDDDAAFATPYIVEQTLAEFDDDRIGAVAMPFVNIRSDGVIRQQAPDDARRWIADAFVGTSYAVRRGVFLRLGGFRESFFHQGEEREFCTRMLAAGFVTRLGHGDPVHHYQSPRRDLKRVHVYARRNDILYAWLDVPMPYLPFHVVGTVMKGIWFGLRMGRVRWMVEGVLAGLAACAAHRGERRAIGTAAYRMSRYLRKHRPVLMERVIGEAGLALGSPL